MTITRDQLQPGDCLIEKGSGLFGWAAKTFIDSDYQHVLVVTDIKHVGLESTWSGVAYVEIPEDLSRYVVRRPLCLPYVYRAAIGFMREKLNEPYGYFSVAMMWLRRATGWTWLPDVPGYFCSELYCYGFSRAAYDVVPAKTDHDSTPLDLFQTDRLKTV